MRSILNKNRMKKISALVLFLMFFCLESKAQWLWDVKKMQEIKRQIKNYTPAYKKLISDADQELKKEPYSVTYKKGIAPSGVKNDYVSLSRYWWPNPETTDKLPYIYKDGQSNPELNEYDRNTLGKMCASVNTLALAYFYSGNEKYAKKASEFLQVWFMDPATKMNPHLEYAQFIPGRDGSKGRPEGLIDSYSFVDMLNSLQLMKGSKYYTKELHSGLQQWFSALAQWFQTSSQGIREEAAKNNHATSYDSQMMVFYLFAGEEAKAKAIAEAFPKKRIDTQIEPDGKQPHELRRTLSYHYSLYNLAHMFDAGVMSKALGVDFLNYVSADGKSFYKALDYLVGYVGKELQDWPYQQISGWEEKQQETCLNLLKIVSFFPEKQQYQEVIKKHFKFEGNERFVLYYGKPIE